MKYKLLAYALDFVSFLVQKSSIQDEIKNIILYGSVARGEAGRESDIDLFVDVIRERKEIEKDIKKRYEEFRESTKYKQYWKMLDIQNEIKINVGEIKKWKELQSSVVANGIVLYGKYKSMLNQGEHKAIFVWENIKPNTKRVLFNKQFLGYTQNKKHYEGLLQKHQGDRLGKGCVIVNLEHAAVIHNFFKKNKITVKIKKFIEY